MNIDEMSDDEFTAYFRLSKNGFEYVHRHIVDMIQPTRVYTHTLSSRQRLLVCIRLEKESLQIFIGENIAGFWQIPATTG
jgi:hypothetical protein